MKEENRKSRDERADIRNFENRYMNLGSDRYSNSQKPKSYPEGFKKDAVSTQTATSQALSTIQVAKPNVEAVASPITAAALPQFTRPASAPKPVATQAVSVHKPEVKPKPERWLSSRDLEVLEFALDMKFVSVQDVYERFFSMLKNGEHAKSDWWAVKRMSQLSQAGFLKPVNAFSEPTRYFIATAEAYEAVMQKITSEKVPKHVNSIDQRIFLHDKLVLKSRLEFEKANPGCRWISDRRLRAGMASMFGLPSAYIPDGIYELPTGERVAFELENAMKGKSAYQEKISFFAKLMKEKRDYPGMFNRVNFRCVREDVFKKLVDETEWHQGLFTVELWKPDFLYPTNKPSDKKTPATETEESV